MHKILSYTLATLLCLSLALNVFFYLRINADGRHLPALTDAPITRVNQGAERPSDAPDDQSKTLLTTAQQAFTQHEFVLAIEHYDDLQHIDETQASQLRSHWLKQIKIWLNNQEWTLAQQALQVALHYQPYATDFLELEAYRLTLTSQFNEAIDTYYVLLSNTFEVDEQARITALLHRTIQDYIDILTLAQQWQSLVAFLEKVRYEEPNHYAIQLTLANALIQLTQFDDATVLLTQLTALPEYRVAAEKLLFSIEKQALGQQAIALEKIGSHYLVNGDFGPNSATELMIDTGASLSVLTQLHFDHVSHWQYPTYVRTTEFSTAGGLVNAPIYRFERFSISGYTINNIEFAVIDLPSFTKGDGLLGMNFLQHFTFQIDQINHSLILEYR